MVDMGFLVQVGSQTIDNKNKNPHRRMDRVTTTFSIKSAETYVANPLGGGLYLRVPYLSNLGVVNINITGDVVQAPIFSSTSLQTTNEVDWNSIRTTAPGPWVDLVSKNFLFSVPASWITAYDYAHVNSLLQNYTLAMDGVSDLLGYPHDFRNNYVLYLSVDLYIKHGGYGIGYPQVNDLTPANENGPQPSGHGTSPGMATHWLVTDILHERNDVCYHELGHAQHMSKYRGETEAMVNILYAYVSNAVFGNDLDEAFLKSIRGGLYTIDGAAIHWMITENFRNGNEMDHSNTESDEFRYQHRGHAKYADIARLYSWQVMSDMYYQEHMDINIGNLGPGPTLADSDERTLRFSIAAGEDLTPLIRKCFYLFNCIGPFSSYCETFSFAF